MEPDLKDVYFTVMRGIGIGDGARREVPAPAPAADEDAPGDWSLFRAAEEP